MIINSSSSGGGIIENKTEHTFTHSKITENIKPATSTGATTSKTYTFTQDYDLIMISSSTVSGITNAGSLYPKVTFNGTEVNAGADLICNVKSGDVLKFSQSCSSGGTCAFQWRIEEVN